MSKSWNEYHADMAEVVASKSKDPSSKVGCVIVDADNGPISNGYNGFIAKSDESFFTWERPRKYLTVLHAEENAIIYAKRDISGAKVYITHSPCNRCLALLAQAKVREIYYSDPSIIRDRGSDDVKWAIEAIIRATGVSVTNVKNGKAYIDELYSEKPTNQIPQEGALSLLSKVKARLRKFLE